MLTLTDARKANVQGKFRKPSTKRSEVVKPTSNSPPTISHNHAMKILSLDATETNDNLSRHGEARHHRQQDRAPALPRVHGRPHRGDHRGCRISAWLGTRLHGRLRRRCLRVPDLMCP